MAEQKKKVNWIPTPEQGASGLLDGATAAMHHAAKEMLRQAPGLQRFVLKRVAGAPAAAFELISGLDENDRKRALVEAGGGAIGGHVGGRIGAVLGVEAGPPGVLAGAAVGSVVGGKAGELIYEHGDDIKTWMRNRARDLVRKAGEAVRAWTPAPYRQFL
jgi:phage tail tape-measure protein